MIDGWMDQQSHLHWPKHWENSWSNNCQVKISGDYPMTSRQMTFHVTMLSCMCLTPRMFHWETAQPRQLRTGLTTDWLNLNLKESRSGAGGTRAEDSVWWWPVAGDIRTQYINGSHTNTPSREYILHVNRQHGIGSMDISSFTFVEHPPSLSVLQIFLKTIVNIEQEFWISVNMCNGYSFVSW